VTLVQPERWIGLSQTDQRAAKAARSFIADAQNLTQRLAQKSSVFGPSLLTVDEHSERL